MSSGQEQRGAGLARRELHFYWLLDTSGSMLDDGKIVSLNEAIRGVTDTVREAAEHNTRGDLIIHALQFDDGARWVSADFQTGVHGRDFEWPNDLTARGLTDLGLALEMLAEEIAKLPNNAFKPVICLVTDGKPSDSFERGLQKLMDSGWGKEAFRIAIAIGNDADLDICRQFVNNPEIPVLRAESANEIKNYIKWVSNTVSRAKGDQIKFELPRDEWVEADSGDAGGHQHAQAGHGGTAPDVSPPPVQDDKWVN